MMKKMFFVLTVLLFTTIHSYSQESCSCSSTAGGCSASQTCPAGKSAICICSLTGCSSSCSSGADLPPSEFGGVSKIENANAENIGSILSSIYGVNVQFKQTSKSYMFSNTKGSKKSLWDFLEDLSKNGELSINGQKIDFWKSMKKTLVNGGEFKICSGGASAQRVVNVLSFISGKNYLVTSGDAGAKITGQIQGNNLVEVLESLQKVGGVSVAEND